MAWLFKSKATKLRPDPRVRWFGKLPNYADYYSSPAEEPWTVEFREWVLAGCQMHQSRRSGAVNRPGQRLPAVNWLVRLPKSGMTVFAAFQDYGGDMLGRPFPLCFFAGLPTGLLPGPTHEVFPEVWIVLGDLAALHRDVVRYLRTPGRFETVFAGREVNFDRSRSPSADHPWKTQAKGLSLVDWFQAVQPSLKVKDAAAWFRLASQWGGRIAQLDSKSFEPTLRLPLAFGMPGDVQAAGWLLWLGARMDLQSRAVSLAVHGGTAAEPGSLGLIARDLVAEDFLLLTPMSHTLPYVDDLARQEAAPADAASSPMEMDVTTWLDFAEQGGRPNPRGTV